MIKRRRLGPVYELSPAAQVGEWLVNNIGKVMFSIVAWLIWIGVYYMILYVVRILMQQSVTDDNTQSINSMMHSEISQLIIFIGMVLITIYVLRDPMKNKRKRRH